MPIFEFIRSGAYVKVSAIDEESGIEAVSILPANLSRNDMMQAATKRLEYVIKKKSGSGNNSGSDFIV